MTSHPNYNAEIVKQFALILVGVIGMALMATTVTGAESGQLKVCPGSPNCVCSDDSDAEHQIEPLRPAGDQPDITRTWAALREALASEPRTTIVEETDTYIRAEARSALFRFVDDVEFLLRTNDGLIAVRSASRTGYSDLGVNRARIERIRAALHAQSNPE